MLHSTISQSKKQHYQCPTPLLWRYLLAIPAPRLIFYVTKTGFYPLWYQTFTLMFIAVWIPTQHSESWVPRHLSLGSAVSTKLNHPISVGQHHIRQSKCDRFVTIFTHKWGCCLPSGNVDEVHTDLQRSIISFLFVTLLCRRVTFLLATMK